MPGVPPRATGSCDLPQSKGVRNLGTVPGPCTHGHNAKGLKGCLRVPIDLCTLARNACSCPVLHRFAKAWPNKPGADQLDQGPDAWMGESMHQV